MKQSLLRKTVLISLLGLAFAQTSSWGEPFTVDPTETAAAPTDASPTDVLPSQVETLTQVDSITPGISDFPTLVPTSFPISDSDSTSLSDDITSLPSDSSSLAEDTTTLVVSSIAIGTGNLTSVASTMTPSGSSSMRSTARSTPTESSTPSEPTSSGSVPSTGAAAPMQGYQKMVLVGAIAGIGGAMFL